MPRLVVATPLNVAPEDRSIAEQALTAVAKCRFVSRASVLAAFGPSGLRAELLEGWIQAGVLHEGRVKLDPLGSVETPYLALTRAGARALAAATGADADGVAPGLLRRASQRRGHDVCVGELGLSVIALARDHLVDLVGLETDDQRLAFTALLTEPAKPPERVALRPDALMVVRGPMGPVAFLVEVDRGTVSVPTMRRRYQGYVAWQRDGGPLRDFGRKSLRVLTIVPSEARCKALHGAALEANRRKPSGFLLFGLQHDFSVCVAERMLGPVVFQLGAVPEFRVPLLPRAPLHEAPLAA